MLQKIYISNKLSYFENTSNNSGKHGKLQTALNIGNNQMFLVQQIKMISEGSCGTEEWSNDAP